jgi:5'(3')-deoxyribonucleotidase
VSDITLDLDDVVYPCVEVIRQYLVDVHGFHASDLIVPPTWDLHEHWGFDKKDLWDLVYEGVLEGYVFTHGLPISGAKHAIDELRRDGHKINFVTARKSRRRVSITKKWLRTHDISYDGLYFDEDKTCVYADFALDDRVENFEALYEHTKGRAFLMAQPWNRYVFTSQRVNSMNDFLWRVRAELGDSRCRPSLLSQGFSAYPVV